MFQTEEDLTDPDYWVNNRLSPTSSVQQISSPMTWMNLTASAFENGNDLIHYTHQLSNTSSTDFAVEDTDTQTNEEVIDESMCGKSYDVFENKLREGFLEATGLRLVCAPPAMFDYKPPLHRVDLKDNKIQLLPDHFFDDLPMLCWCDLRYNRLESLPHFNAQHDNLNVLLVQDNQISELPCSLAYAVNLHTLGWTNNCIVEPPRQILFQGCESILKYLREVLIQRLPLDEDGNLVGLPSDTQLEKDLDAIKKKAEAKRSASRCSVNSSLSMKSVDDADEEKRKQQKRLDRIKYTWGLWKNIPYRGVSSQTLFEKSVKEVKDEVRTRLNKKRDEILQKLKDNEAVDKWRQETRMMQMTDSLKPYAGVLAPFGTDKDMRAKQNGSDGVDPETFQTTLKDCMKKLQSFSDNPAPINDTRKSLQRLREVEDVQRKLLDIKLSWSVKTSGPV